MSDIRFEVGMKVYYTPRWGSRTIDKVARLTNSQVILEKNPLRFQKINGRSIGGGTWHTEWIEPLTPEIEKEIIAEQELGKYRNFLIQFDFKNCKDLIKLKACYEIFNPIEVKE